MGYVTSEWIFAVSVYRRSCADLVSCERGRNWVAADGDPPSGGSEPGVRDVDQFRCFACGRGRNWAAPAAIQLQAAPVLQLFVSEKWVPLSAAASSLMMFAGSPGLLLRRCV